MADTDRTNSDAPDRWTRLQDENKRMRFALAAVDHTLSAHGHIDADTPLHEVVRAALA